MTSPVADPIAIIKNVLHADTTPQHHWGGSGGLRSGGGSSRHSSAYVSRGYTEKTQHRGSAQMFLGHNGGGPGRDEQQPSRRSAHPSPAPHDAPAPCVDSQQSLPPHCSGLEEHLEFHRQSVIGTVFPQATSSSSAAAAALPPPPPHQHHAHYGNSAPGTPVSQMQRRGLGGGGGGSSSRVLNLPRSPLLDSPRTPSALDYHHHHHHHRHAAPPAASTPASLEISALKQQLLEPSAADAGGGPALHGREGVGGGANVSIVSEAYNCIQQQQPQQPHRSSALRRSSAALPASDSLALQLLETQTELIALLKSTGVTGFPLPSSPPRDAATGRHAVPPPAQNRHNGGDAHGRSVQYGDDYEVSRSVSGRGSGAGGVGGREQVRTPRVLHGGGGGGGGWSNPYPVPHDYSRRGVTTPRDSGAVQSAAGVVVGSTPPARYSSSVAYLRESR